MLTALSNLAPLPDFIQDCDLSFCKSSAQKSVLSKTNSPSPELRIVRCVTTVTSLPATEIARGSLHIVGNSTY